MAVHPAAYAADADVTIAQVDGQTVSNGAVAADVRGSTLTLAGSAVVPAPAVDPTPPLVADAGDSSYVLAGTPANLIASAGGGTAPYTYAWSYDGASSRFGQPAEFQTTFTTTGLTGVVTAQLTVTDADGRTDTDNVQLFVYTVSQKKILDVSGQAGAGLIVNNQTFRHPFTVPSGVQTTKLDLLLDWGTSYALPGNAPGDEDFGGFNLAVEDPSGADVSAGQGAQFTKPEDVTINKVPSGQWTAVVTQTVTAPDTYRVQATATMQPADPTPSIASGGPYAFRPGQAQVLRATAAGGTAPLVTEWDLDYDGVFETPDTADGVTTALPLGNHLVTVKTTDGAGYEKRETTAVRVTQETTVTGAPGLVVVAVSDSGINPYHADWRATTFPDADILALTENFTKHPSTYIPGYPAATEPKNLTFDRPFAAGKLHPAEDAALWTKATTPLNKMFWIPGTKIVAAVDTGDSQPVNGAPDVAPILDEDGHGTASASTAVGNLYGYCPTCLLAFGENFNSDAFFHKFSWVDLSSNSFGSLANVGFAGLIDAAQTKNHAERGQIALYAAGNGNENAFLTPEQTYTSENLGADWLVRVGAANRATRQPIIGTGKPVDISSWGLGSGTTPLTAADNASPGGTTTHSGTSAATPYSSGVFGTVLGQVREVLGDKAPGQKNTTGNGVIATGTPLATSPYLKDGQLTRAELVEAVFKTAQHDTRSSISFPPTSPGLNPAQYVVEGYGLVEPESGLRALDVLLGKAPLPLRPAEDRFFAADSQLRDELWGTWSGGGANSATPQASAAVAPNPFAGTTPAMLSTFDSAYALLSSKAGPFQSAVMAEALAAQAAGGTTFYAHHLGGCVNNANPGPFLDTVDSEGDDDGCGGAGTSGVTGTREVESWSTQASAPVTVTIPKDTAVKGVVYLQTQQPTSSLVTVTVSAGGRVLGSTQTEVLIVEEGLFGEYAPVPVDFATASAVAPGETLTMSVTMDLSPTWFFGYEGDHATFLTFATTDGGGGGTGDALGATITGPADGTTVDPAAQPTIPVTGTATFPTASGSGNAVQVSVDDPTFAAPLSATLGTDGTWGTTLDATALADGPHTVYARATDGTASSTPVSTGFTVARRVDPPPPGVTVVQVQVTAAGVTPSDTAWVDAQDTSADGDLSSWSAALDISGLERGDYAVHARLLAEGATAAVDGPVSFTKKSKPAKR